MTNGINVNLAVRAGNISGVGGRLVTSQTRQLIDTVTSEASRLRDFLAAWMRRHGRATARLLNKRSDGTGLTTE